MTAPPSHAPHPTNVGTCPIRHGSPFDPTDSRIPLYSPEFAADPHRLYRDMRDKFGSLVPVELAPGIPATLVIGYHTARRVLHDPEHFPADPRTWQHTVPTDTPVLPMMRWQPAARHTTGPVHTRYRAASVAALAGVDTHALHDTVEHLAIPLINAFSRTGRADLLTDYATPLILDVLNRLIGCPPDIGQQVAQGMAMRFDTIHATQGMTMIEEALTELITLKRTHPGNDVTTRFVQHLTNLDDTEIFAQLMSFYGAGFEAQRNLLVNTVRVMLTDDRFAGHLLDGSLTTRDGLDEVLFTDPPIANFCTTYPRQPVLLEDTWLPAHQPVVISIAACNNDPAIVGGDRTGNRSHLAWSTGPHACPAQTIAYQVVQDAIDQLLDALPDIRLAIPASELTWRPGPFHRALTTLPVTFTPTPPLNTRQQNP